MLKSKPTESAAATANAFPKTKLLPIMPRAPQPRFPPSLTAWFSALVCAAQIFGLVHASAATLGTTILTESPAAGTDSVVLAITPENSAWTATANAAWLHLNLGFESGTGSTNIIFTFDANPGTTRTGTLTIADQTLTVTQAGSTHVAASGVVNLVTSGLSSPTSVAVDNAGNVYIADRNSSTIKKWIVASNTTNTLVNSGLNLPNAVAVDSAGNVYIADSGNAAIKKWSVASNTVTTLVATGLTNPYGVAVDGAGNVFIADSGNNAIKKWSITDSNVTTLVNSNLSQPISVAVDAAGNVYIADTFNNAIKKWTAANSNVTTLVASGLSTPAGVAVDGAGNVYIANTFGQSIRKWTAANNTTTTLVSSGLVQPNGVAVDSAGNVYIANTGNNSIRELPRAFVDVATKFTGAGAGSDTLSVVLPTTTNLRPPFAPISNQPWLTIGGATNGAVTVNFTANLGISRTANLTVLGQTVPVTQVAPALPEIAVQQLGGTNLTDGAATNDFGTGLILVTNLAKTFVITNSGATNLTGLVITKDGAQPSEFIIGALGSNDLPANSSTTFTVSFAPAAIGNRSAAIHIASNDADENPFDITLTGVGIASSFALAANTRLVGPAAGSDSLVLAVAPELATWTATPLTPWLHLSPPNQSGAGSTNVTFTFDANSGATRTGTLIIAGKTFTVTQAGLGYVPAGAVATVATTGASQPYGVTADSAGNVYFADPDNNTIKKWTATNNTVTSLVSTGLNLPYGVAVDAVGNVYIADTANSAIKKWTATNNSVTTLVATGLNYPSSVALDAAGNIYIADTINNAVKMWNVTNNAVTTLVDSGLVSPFGVAVDASGNVYIADTYNSSIKKWTAANNTVNTLVSSGLSYPYGVAVDTAGNIYIADTENSAIKKWTALSNTVTTLVASGINSPFGVGVDAAGNVYFSDSGNKAIKALPRTFVSPTNKNVGFGAGNDVLPSVLPSNANLLAPFAPVSTQPWLTVSGITNGVISFAYAANPGASRSASLIVFGQTNTINQAANPVPEIAVQQPAGANLTDGAATSDFGSVYVLLSNSIKTYVITNSGSTNLTGLAITKNGAHPGDFTVSTLGSTSLAANASTTFTVTFATASVGSRSAAIHIASNDADENPFDITLIGTGLAPVFSLTPTTHSVAQTAGSNSVALTVTPANATWTANANASWLHVNPADQNGTGSATIGFTFDANPGALRVGTFTIAGQTLTVTQAALPYLATLGMTNLVEGPTAGSNSVVLLIVPVTSSAWTATTNASWLHLNTANQSGTGSTNVIFSFDANPGAARTGTLTIAGQTLTITQGGTNHFAVTTVTPLVSTALSLPHGVAVDNVGNVYIADTYNNAIKKWTLTNNTVTTLVATGLNMPYGVAVDDAGNVYIADTQNNVIKKWTAANGNVITIIASGLNLPFGIAVDVAGNIYIADRNNYAIKKWTAADNTISNLVTTGLNLPNGVAVDVAGNVYIADTFNNTVKKWTVANNTVTTLVASGLNLPSGIAVDGSGNVYIADRNNNAIKKWLVTSNTVVPVVATGLNLPYGVAVNREGSIYIADAYNVAIKELPRAFVDQTPRVIGNAAGVSSIPVVLPASANLLAPFAPTNNQAWLTSSGTSTGTVTLTYTANLGASRSANLTVLGRTIPVTQTLVVTSPLLSYAVTPSSIVLNFPANSGQIYQIESAPAVTGPWTTNTTLTGPLSGILSYTNVISTSGNRFFRTRTP